MALANAPDSLAVTGATPDDMQRFSLGLFKRRASDVNGKPSYVMQGLPSMLQGHSDTMLWHAGRRWYIGSASNVGKAKGFVSARDGALRPDEVAATWQVWSRRDLTWVDAPALRCISGEWLATALASAPRSLAVTGATPDGLQRDRLGVFHRRATDVHGMPSYVKQGDDSTMLWHAGGCWYLGPANKVGETRGWVSAPDGALRPDEVAATWQVWRDSGKTWVDAPALRVSAHRCPADRADDEADDVVVTHEQTREPKNAELFKRGIDLEDGTPRKRSRRQVEQLEERVAKVRSSTDSAIQRRMEELAAPAVAAYMKDEIDAAELDRRKAAARTQATADHHQRTALDKAFDEYTAARQAREEACKAREAACRAHTAAVDAEEAAEAALYNVLQPLEAGPSGSVKAER